MNYPSKTNQTLLLMYNGKTVKKSCFSVKTLRLLYADAIIENSANYHDDNVYLTDKGEAYVEAIIDDAKEKSSAKIHSWINSVGVILSLILSVLALLL